MNRQADKQRPKRDLVQVGDPVVTLETLSQTGGSCECRYPTSASDFGSITDCSECLEGAPIAWQATGFEAGLGLPMCVLAHTTGCEWESTCDNSEGQAITATLSFADATYVYLTVNMGSDGTVKYYKPKALWGCNCNNKLELICPSSIIGASNLPCSICLTPLQQIPIVCCAGSGLPDQMSVEITQLNNLSSLQPIDGTVVTLDFVNDQPGFGVTWDGYLGSVVACENAGPYVKTIGGVTHSKEIQKLLFGLACFGDTNCGQFCGNLYAIFGYEIEHIITGGATTIERAFDYILATALPPVPPSGHKFLDCNTLSTTGRSFLRPTGAMDPILGMLTSISDPCTNYPTNSPDGLHEFEIAFTD